MQRAAAIAVLSASLGLFVGCGPKDKGAAQDGGDAGGKGNAKGEAAEADLTISATELYAAYKAAPQAADRRFKGKRLAVSGTVGLRDDNPKGLSKTIRFGLKGSSEKNEFVACYFPWEGERYFHRLDAKPPPPIVGTCEGAAESEYGKKGARPMEVRLTNCVIPEVPGVKTPYDKGFAEGQSVGAKHLEQYQKANAVAKKDYADQIRKMAQTYREMHEVKAANMKPGGVFPSDVDRVRGILDGYLKAVEPSGIK